MMSNISPIVCVLLPVVTGAVDLRTPPIYNITAKSLYDAGLQHGRLARDRIRRYLELEEMRKVWNFSQTTGKEAYIQLRQHSTMAYPQYAEEFRGIAEGAGVDLDRVWAVNLIIELENLMNSTDKATHCSDIFAVSSDGYQKGFAHGHNEDWSQEVAEHIYYVKYTALPGADFESCAGLIYPSGLTGWGVSWNTHGIFFTVNTLTPKKINAVQGVTTAFVQKDALCGIGRGRSIDDIAAHLHASRWADGASINIVDLKGRRMANVETYEDTYDVIEVTAEMGNYSHFNMYKHLGHGDIDAREASTIARQARADVLPAPHSAEDVMSILSDAQNKDLPIFRKSTMVSHVVDGNTGTLRIWCCQNAPTSAAPVHEWNIFNFWNHEQQSITV